MNRLATILAMAVLAAIASPHRAHGQANSFSWGGFLSNGYLKSSHYNYLVASEEGSFDFAEAGINAVWSPIERTTLNGQLFAFELGPYGNFEPLIDYLFVDHTFNNSLALRAGRIKRPAGVYSEIQDIDVARSTILLPIGIYDQRYRDVFSSFDGLSLYGNAPFLAKSSFSFNAFGGLVELEPDGGLGGFIHSRLSRGVDNTVIELVESEYVFGHQTWWNSPVPGLRLGASFSYYNEVAIETESDLPAYHPQLPGASYEYDLLVDYLVYMYSIEWYMGDWTLVGELYKTVTKIDETQIIASAIVTTGSGNDYSDAWYASISRRLFDKFQAGITYTEFYINSNRRGRNDLFVHDLQFSLRYDATDFWSLKAEYHDLSGANRLFNQFNQNPALDQAAWTMFAMKSTLTF